MQGIPDLSSEVELFLSAVNLPNYDTFSKSDTFAVFYVGNAATPGVWSELGRTKTIMDSLNPNWAEQFKLSYRFEEIQPIKVDVYDRDSKSNKLKDHDHIGSIETQLGTVFGSRGQTLRLPLKGGKRHKGELIIKGEEIRESNQVLRVQFAGQKLDKKDFFGKSDPFLEAYRCREDGSYVKVWESPVIKNTLNPVWKPIDIPVQTLCNGDIHRPIVWKVFDWDKSGGNDLIGIFNASVNDIAQPGFSRPVINEKKQKKKKSYKNSGIILAKSAQIAKQITFLDYIAGGCEMNLTVAVDFTGSNGNPRSPGSLHYINPSGQMNEYQSALSAVGQILMNYDSDQAIPLYEFGGVVPGLGTQHCYPMNLNPSAPEVFGVQGMLDCYQQGIQTIGLSGPTLFGQILGGMRQRIVSEGCSQDMQKYHLLLILTDGVINDMGVTVEHIVAMSELPVSIVIVGVGNANFDSMDTLDGDDGMLSSGGRIAKRDIVQFVPFRDFKTQHFSVLAKHTLAEIPGQLLAYMHQHGISPNPRTMVVEPPMQQPMGTGTTNSGLSMGGAAMAAMAFQQSAVPCQAPVDSSQQAVACAVPVDPSMAVPVDPSMGGAVACAVPVDASQQGVATAVPCAPPSL
eukprot:TRINITY_DN779775_c0_g1_i1.p1 TRINITY_DN779775_c0_g1~~TRINITY_DN779775_c0_g1_i1.p1  ORF type:complete len:626 (-),score=199.47 TRINITY_DN779775_c0_g1_i1:208-2085(-)